MTDDLNALASQWQPIETAPRDGTRVDLWVPGSGRLASARWKADPDPRWACWTTYSHSVRCVSRHILWSNLKPTHWMPLPVPPAPQQEGQR